jgi:hypothetical protein
MARPKKSDERDALFDAVTNRDGLVCFMCGAVHSRAATMQLDWLDHDDLDVTNLDHVILACKTCVRRRDKRPLMAYLKTRLSAARAEVAHLSVLPEDIRIKQMLTRPIHYAPRITPGAVEATDPKAPVLTRPTRIFEYYSLPDADRNAEAPFKSYPKNPQHGDIFIHATEEVQVWDATWELKNGSVGTWPLLTKAVERGTFPADWARNPAHEVYPPADYAPSITPETPHAVVGTGHNDALEEDPVVMAAARVAPDADTEVTSVWFDGELYWRELCYTHPVTGEETLTDEVFTPD